MTRSAATWDPKTRGRFCILAAALLWSFSGAFVKSLPLDPYAIATFRSLSAGVFLAAIAFPRGVRPTWNPIMAVMVVAFTLMSYVFVKSMTETTAANAIFLQYTAPVWMTLGSLFLLGEKSDRRQWSVLAGSLAGVAVIVVGNLQAGGSQLVGIALGLLSGVTYATVAVALRYLRQHDPLWLTTLNHLAAGLILLGLGAVLAGAGSQITFPVDPGTAVALIAFGIIQMGLPYLLFGIGLRTVSPQEAGILTLTEPVLNPVWTYLAVGEIPSAPTVVGGAILLAMLLLRYFPGAQPTG